MNVQILLERMRDAPHGLPRLVAALLLGLMALEIISLSGGFRPASMPAGAAQHMVLPVPQRTPVDLGLIASAMLFGHKPELSTLAASQSQSTLQLSGTFAHSDPRTGFAIIGTAAGPGMFYRVGSDLGDGSTLFEVHPDHVLVSRGGQLEYIAMPRLDGSSPPSRYASTTVSAAGEQLAASIPVPVPLDEVTGEPITAELVRN
jgi:type II secretory pathway component PulC